MLRADRPFSLTIFGASGHLARIKIFPALYFLALKKRLPEEYAIVGFARTSMTDDAFRALVAESVKEHVLEVNEKVLQGLLDHVFYHTGNYTDIPSFTSLAAKLKVLEDKTKNMVRLAYMSIPPSVFSATIENLCAGGVHDQSVDFRCIVEKPVGSDLQTFEQVNKRLASCFRQDEVYILDHYLGKEAVRNAYYLRYGNPVIESLLKNTLLSHVQITASESAGLEGRAGYFDAVGTLRDMFQSHLIQIAALLTMRLASDTATMKQNRLEAIRQFLPPSVKDLSTVVIQGQYGTGESGGKKVCAYREEEGVHPGTRTATFAAMKLMTKAPHFEGVPFFLRSGKRLKEKETRISIEFQESPTLAGKDGSRNRLDIILQGEAGMKLFLQTKLGGSEPKFRPLVMEDPLVCMGDCMAEHSLLILEAVNGTQQWYLDPEEVRACWKIIDPLQRYLDDPRTPLAIYPSGSRGPAEADAFIAASGHHWF